MPPFMLAFITVQKIAFWERERRRVMQLVDVIGPAGGAAGPRGNRVQRIFKALGADLFGVFVHGSPPR